MSSQDSDASPRNHNSKYNIYPTKPNGDEWYMDDNIENDHRVKLSKKGPIHKEGNFFLGSADPGMNPPSFRIEVSQSNGYDEDKTQILAQDRKNAAIKRYLQDQNDWTDYEMTGYFKVVNGDDQITMYGRGGKHDDKHGDKPKCQGSAYKARLFFKGKPDLGKEYYHENGHGYQYSSSDFEETTEKRNIQSILNRWIGMKTCVFNLPNGNVKIEIWVDEKVDSNGNPIDPNTNTWDKIYEIVDSGQMGKKDFPINNCGAPSNNQIFNWGGPQVTFRIDTVENMGFQKLSVREIVPPDS